MRLASAKRLIFVGGMLAGGCVDQSALDESALEADWETPDGGAELEEKIFQGTPVGTCGWPTTVYTGGCTGALVHERVISTAQHCGRPTRVTFGETASGARSVRVKRCIESGPDSQLCELEEAVTGVPITPLLFGCELSKYLRRDTEITVVGFGRDDSRNGRSGTKQWARQVITAVNSTTFTVHAPSGETTSLCNGDSGGPAYVRVADGSWRVLGTTWRKAGSGPICRGFTEYARPDVVVRTFEQQTGIDITPCFGSDGAWKPGPSCRGFFAGDHRGSGSWSNWCSGTRTTGYSAECGAAFNGGGGGGGGDQPPASCQKAPTFISDEQTGYGACEGDCDTNSDCAGGLVCFQANTGDNIPGCRGRSVDDDDYCVHPSWAVCGGGGSVPPPPASCQKAPTFISNGQTGYGACEGDCDTNSDCAGGLVCFQANTGDNIPGCRGRSGSNTDYCVHPSWAVCR